MGRLGRPWNPYARLAGAVGVAGSVALGALAVLGAEQHRAPTMWLVVVACIALASGIVFAFPAAIGLGALAMGAAGLVAALPAMPLFALGVFVATEAALGAVDARPALGTEFAAPRDHLWLVAAVGAGSVAVGSALYVVTRDSGEQGGGYTLVAGASVVALAVLLVAGDRLARLSRRGAPARR